MKEKLAGLIFDIPYQDLSGYQVEKVEAINQLLIEAEIRGVRSAHDIMGNALTIKVYELQKSLKDKS